MKERYAGPLAWALFALFVALVVAGGLVTVLGPAPEGDLFFLAVLGFAWVGALVASRQARNPIGWLLLAIGITLALGALVDASLMLDDAPARGLFAWLSDWTWYVWLTLAGIFLPLLFPTGRPLSPRWRRVLWLGVAALVLSVLGSAFDPGRLDVDSAVPVDNPFGIGGAMADVWPVMSRAGDVLAGIAFALAAASLVVRFRRSRGVERQQLKWFAYVGLLAATGLAVAMAQVLFGAQPSEDTEGGWLEVVGAVGWFTALGAIVFGIPLATGMAILRHRLYDIDVVINRTLVYGALTATLVASYVGLVLLLQLALSPLTEESDLAIAGSTLAVAALFRPLRSRIQRLVDRRFYRRRYDARQTVEAFGVRLRDEVELDSLSAELRGVVAETMQPAHVSLWLRAEAGR
ncbi:MAG TPA: hypothetical protein VG126_02070 [Thermoleophilaceae bacterium]|nr:hypothetical protein [Thermoleophilaceae bacterium]